MWIGRLCLSLQLPKYVFRTNTNTSAHSQSALELARPSLHGDNLICVSHATVCSYDDANIIRQARSISHNFPFDKHLVLRLHIEQMLQPCAVYTVTICPVPKQSSIRNPRTFRSHASRIGFRRCACSISDIALLSPTSGSSRCSSYAGTHTHTRAQAPLCSPAAFVVRQRENSDARPYIVIQTL